jgi:hypothetical protein
MRRTETSGWIVRGSPTMTFRALRLAVVPLTVGLVMTASAARAGDDDRTFSEKISDSFFGAIRGTNMDNRGIDYRERSPLVVPPTLDLPPPAAPTGEAQIANWPKDPDERQRKAVIAAKKKNAPPPGRVLVSTAGGTAVQAAQPINIAPPVDAPPAQVPDTVRRETNNPNGTGHTDPVYDQAGDLFNGGFAKSIGVSDSLGIGSLFGNKGESAPIPPGTEPARQALTQPPVGYQTPSPNYVYGLEPKGVLSGQSSPDKVNQASPATSVVR